jgi:hypothetical protein
MKHKIFICLSFFLALILCACSKDNNPVSQKQIQPEEQTTANNSAGAVQISGVGFYATATECDAQGQGADYAIRMTGDLEGCLYGYIDEFDCSPSGTYREEGREYFVGIYQGNAGTFWTTYRFEGKFEDCADNGAPLGVEIFGRCQHPVTAGTGTGVFVGATGRIDFKDDIEAGNFPYRGHLQW